MSSQAIHCKVSCKDQFRRFLFNGTEFTSLITQIRTVLGLDGEFVLKYKDNESDLITISSDEEFRCALAYSNGDLLRLSVVEPNQPIVVPSDAETVERRPSWRGYRGGYGHEQGHHGYRGHHGGHRGGHGHEHGHGRRGGCHSGRGPEMWKEKLTAKRDRITEVLSLMEMEGSEENNFKKYKLQKKLEFIEAKLQKLNSGDLMFENKGKCSDKKMRKSEKKKFKHAKRGERKELSEETILQIKSLKSQICALKPNLKGTKSEIRAKKMSLKEAERNGAETETLKKEIVQLKEIKEDLRDQIIPVKEKIRSLKYSAC